MNLENGCLPAAVRSAETIFSPVVFGHCAGSSARTKVGARPCARFGSEPIHLIRAPVALCSILACCAVSQTRHFRSGTRRARSASSSSDRNAWQCSNDMRACSKLEATITVSPRGTHNGPGGTVAVATAANRVDFPFPRPTDSPAVSVSGANAPRINRRSHGQADNRDPASRP